MFDESGFYTEQRPKGDEIEVYGCPDCDVSQQGATVRSLGACAYCGHVPEEFQDDD